jgi:hypothetical protein
LIATIALPLRYCFLQMQMPRFPDLDKSPMDVASYPTDYKMRINLQSDPSRSAKGRSLNELAPAGKNMETGANEAANHAKDMKLGETRLRQDLYMPFREQLLIIISKDLNVWGSTIKLMMLLD